MKVKRLNRKRKIAVLRQARKLISRPKGWSKGLWVDFSHEARKGYPALCLGAACQQAALDLGLVYDGYDLHSDEVAKKVSLGKLVRSKGFRSVPSFNDAGPRTRKDVLAVIDERIAILEAEEAQSA